jgi:SAM-dependent methyltransferase
MNKNDQDFFWEPMETIMFSKRRLSPTGVDVDNIVTLLGMKPRMRVLDLCCGIGRYSLEFARRGFRVTGVDLTQFYLEKASKQAESEGLEVEFIQSDMRSFHQPDTFDVIVNLDSSFGFFEDPAEDRRILTNMYRSLKTGGRFLQQMKGKETIAREFRERDWYKEGDRIVVKERVIKQDWGFIDLRWTIFDGVKRDEKSITMRLYSAVELSSLLNESGFNWIKVYGNLSGSPYDHRAECLVTAGSK